MRIQSTTILSAALAALLSACGGGSTGDSGTVGGTNPVAISSSNQTNVARATVAGSVSVGHVQTADNTGRATAQSVSVVRGPAGAGAVDVAVRATLAHLFDSRRHATSAGVHAAAVVSTTDACAVSGSFSTSFDDRDGSNSTTAGDSATVTFTQCVDEEATISGTLVVNISSVSSTGSQFSGSIAFQNLNVSQGSTRSSINGSATVSEVSDNSGVTVTVTVGSGGLQMSESSPSYTDTITLESGMSIATFTPGTVVATQISVNGTFSSTALGGHVTLATVSPLVWGSVAAYPSSGQIRVTGANGSVLLITAQSSGTQVELQLDADGNGSYEGDTFVAWSALLSQ